MKTQHVCVLVGQYTESNLVKLICNPYVRKVHYLIQNWYAYPSKSSRYRVELELREKNNLGYFFRPANLFELIWFSLHSFERMAEYGSIEGFDPHLEELGKEIGVPLTVPTIIFSGGKIVITLARNDRVNNCLHQLVVTSFRQMKN